MLFTSGEFLFVFLPVTLLVFYVAARYLNPMAAAFWLAIVSLAFYGYWRIEHTVLLLASIAFNFVAGDRIIKVKAKNGGLLSSKTVMIAAVSVNLAVLAYFKYADFFIRTVDELSSVQFSTLNVALPLGISFFTFTQIAYLVDVYAGKVTERNVVHYGLFVTYFPHLIAGPVLHHAEMMPQFTKPEIYRFELRNYAIGLAFLCVGLAKKVLVADTVAPVANDAFKLVEQQYLDVVTAWEGVLAYTTQIYFDFSGYSDMAIGLSLVIGVRLPYNFNSPYKSRSIIDFWRRWHITLSRFLRDYLYIALGGNRRGSTLRYANLLITMLLGGLWHGASWTFVIWGGLHGCYLMINHGWRWLCSRTRKGMAIPGQFGVFISESAALLVTLLCVVVGWVFFRSPDTTTAVRMLASMAGQGGTAEKAVSISESTLPWLLGILLLSSFLNNSQQLIDGYLTSRLDRIKSHALFSEFLAFLVGVEVVAIVFLAFIAASRNVTEFIYFNF